MKTILVVDDEPIVREVVVRYLKREGYRTLEAADGDAARETIEQSGLDLVVLDVMLPGTDGLELCRWIRSESELPVIMLTARGEEIDRVIGFEVGADDYVVKSSFSVRELVLRVLRCGSGKAGELCDVSRQLAQQRQRVGVRRQRDREVKRVHAGDFL